MEQDLNKVEKQYDTVAKEYAESFSGEHEKKPKDQEILHRFSLEIGDRRPVWDFGCGPGQTTKYLKNLGIEISGLDLSEKILEQARTIHPEIHFRKGNILELEFENDSIAGAVAFYAIVHFTEEQVGIAFREVFRVLQPGGIFRSQCAPGLASLWVQGHNNTGKTSAGAIRTLIHLSGPLKTSLTHIGKLAHKISSF